MDKRYQVFVGSTFADLEQERHGIIQTLMQIDCIPAGMELFPAADEEQWVFIQKVIDDCDYYLLIIGGRYGTVSSEGVSYTEKEHDYAAAKGIHIIALLHGEPDQLPVAKSETDEIARTRLLAFRKKVSAGRLVKFWRSPTELLQQVVLSLTHAFKAHPRLGWVRGGTTSSSSLLEQINVLRQRNDDLQKQLVELLAQTPAALDIDLADADSLFKLSGSYVENHKGANWSCDLSWNQIIAVLGPHLLTPIADASVSSTLASAARSFVQRSSGHSSRVGLACLDTIKVQLLALGYIDVQGGFWYLTELGKQVMMRTRTVKAPRIDGRTSSSRDVLATE